MELNVHEPLLKEHPSAKALIKLLQENEERLALEGAVVHHKFPLYVDSDSSTKSTDVMVVSKNYGVLIFKCIDSSKRLPGPSFAEILLDFEQIYSLIFSKLIKSRSLRKSPLKLSIQLKPIIYCFGEECDCGQINDEWDELEVIEQDSDFNNIFDGIKLNVELNEIVVYEILSILEGSQSIRKQNGRSIENLGKESKGAILDEIGKQIAIFDMDQKRAALTIIDGPQRIRGLAGSGKTIVLAMKAARIHLEEPDSRILYTYWTKQLHDYIKNLITRFYRQFSENDPDWTKIDIMHAWGGRNLEGVYYTTCINNGLRPQPLNEVKQYGKEAFNKVCKGIEVHELNQFYDYSILDEAQDFPVYFYRLCRKITKKDRVIWGYDECQNILDIKIQDTIETFGKNASGKPYIDFSEIAIGEQDVVLYKCYRNPRTILVVAIALGFGIYSDKMVQLPENMGHWEDLGFKILDGNYNEGDQMTIIRPEENSPLIKNKLLDNNNNAVEWKVFGNKGFNDECQFVADSIIGDLQEGLLANDIIVISLDDRHARNYFYGISQILDNENIKTFDLLKQPSNTTKFMIEDHVTLTTVYRAKGNEAGRVYIVGIDSIFSNKDSIVKRNRLFTAITRANAWVTITGIGDSALEFEREIQKVVDNNYQLNFVMPNLNTLRKLQRNLEIKQAKYNELNRMIDQAAYKLGTDRDTLLKDLYRKEKVPE